MLQPVQIAVVANEQEHEQEDQSDNNNNNNNNRTTSKVQTIVVRSMIFAVASCNRLSSSSSSSQSSQFPGPVGWLCWSSIHCHSLIDWLTVAHMKYFGWAAWRFVSWSVEDEKNSNKGRTLQSKGKYWPVSLFARHLYFFTSTCLLRTAH